MKKKRILIIEDEDSLLKLESILLTSRGYDVIGAKDGRAGLDELALCKPDLVILDIMLPGIDGFEVCRLIRENSETRAIPVVMLTAKKSVQDYERGMQVGADAFITKPFKSAHVIGIVEQLVSKKSTA